MTSAQKIIKYFAIGIACLIIVSIISGTLYGINIISSIISSENAVMDSMKKSEINIEPNVLKIDIKASKLIIKKSTVFSIETNNKYIKISEEANTLLIKEEKHSFLEKSSKSEIILYIPENYLFTLVEIDAGAGNIIVDSLIANKIECDLGAGNLTINYLNVLNAIDIDGGAGNIDFKDCKLNNLDFDIGVGNASLKGEFLGNTDIDAGVGNLDIKLNGDKETYTINVEKGVGLIKINNKSVKNKTQYGFGKNNITIDGGIGSININTNK